MKCPYSSQPASSLIDCLTTTGISKLWKSISICFNACTVNPGLLHVLGHGDPLNSQLNRFKCHQFNHSRDFTTNKRIFWTILTPGSWSISRFQERKVNLLTDVTRPRNKSDRAIITKLYKSNEQIHRM